MKIAFKLKAAEPKAEPKAEPAKQVETPKPAPVTGLERLKSLSASAPAADIESAVREAVVEEVAPQVTSLDDFLTMDMDVAPSFDEAKEVGFEIMGKIEATAPIRELPADIGKKQLEFVELLNSIYEVLNEPELFKSVVRQLMDELSENPQYEDMIVDQDIHYVMEGARRSMTFSRINKVQKRVAKPKAAGKATSKTTSKAGKAGISQDELDSVLGEIDFGDLGDLGDE